MAAKRSISGVEALDPTITTRLVPIVSGWHVIDETPPARQRPLRRDTGATTYLRERARLEREAWERLPDDELERIYRVMEMNRALTIVETLRDADL